jgi:hypothetical protein
MNPISSMLLAAAGAVIGAVATRFELLPTSST